MSSVTLPPGFDWCGGCATATRQLSESEARALLEQAHSALQTGTTALQVLSDLVWPLEIVGRMLCRTCSCTPAVPRAGFHLYRLWTPDRRLLYVGVSTRLRRRLTAHARKWGALYDHVTWEEHPDAPSMLAAEQTAIRDEHPALNKEGVG